jgi:hypothetical protein
MKVNPKIEDTVNDHWFKTRAVNVDGKAKAYTTYCMAPFFRSIMGGNYMGSLDYIELHFKGNAVVTQPVVSRLDIKRWLDALLDKRLGLKPFIKETSMEALSQGYLTIDCKGCPTSFVCMIMAIVRTMDEAPYAVYKHSVKTLQGVDPIVSMFLCGASVNTCYNLKHILGEKEPFPTFGGGHMMVAPNMTSIDAIVKVALNGLNPSVSNEINKDLECEDSLGSRLKFQDLVGLGDGKPLPFEFKGSTLEAAFDRASELMTEEVCVC